MAAIPWHFRTDHGGLALCRTPRHRANRIAGVLVNEMGLKPGNRVLLRSANKPMLAASWFATLKAGGIAVTTMPLLRTRELSYIVEKARVEYALCDAAIGLALEETRSKTPVLREIGYFGADAADGVEAAMTRQSPNFANCIPSHDDVALIAFTSGTTGSAKATMHFHRDVLASCDLFPRSTLKPAAGDIFTGSPPLGFTYGLGGLLLFPLRFGASTLLLERCTPEILLQAVRDHRITTIFTAPTMYRAMTALADQYDHSSLKACVSAGETSAGAGRGGLAPQDRDLDHRRAGLDRAFSHLRFGGGRRYEAGHDGARHPRLPRQDCR